MGVYARVEVFLPDDGQSSVLFPDDPAAWAERLQQSGEVFLVLDTLSNGCGTVDVTFDNRGCEGDAGNALEHGEVFGFRMSLQTLDHLLAALQVARHVLVEQEGERE